MNKDKKNTMRGLRPPSAPEPPKKRKQPIPTDESGPKERVKKSRDKKTDPMKRTIGVKVDNQLWRRLRALALMQGRLSGELLDEAIKQYIKREKG